MDTVRQTDLVEVMLQSAKADKVQRHLTPVENCMVCSQELRPVGLVCRVVSRDQLVTKNVYPICRHKRQLDEEESLLQNMKSFEELSHVHKVCLMLNRVEKLLKTCRMGSLPYVVKLLVLDTNTSVSQKFMGIDKEEMVMIKCQVSPSHTTLIQSLNSQSAMDIPHMESGSCYSPSTVGSTKKQAELQVVVTESKINKVPLEQKGMLCSNQFKPEPNVALSGSGNSCSMQC